jgi:hypothetical protein
MPIIGHLSENYAKASDLGLGFNRPMDYEEDTASCSIDLSLRR